MKINKLDAYYARVKSATGEESASYFIDVSKQNVTLEGKDISIFIISSFVSTDELEKRFEAIAKSFKLKTSSQRI